MRGGAYVWTAAEYISASRTGGRGVAPESESDEPPIAQTSPEVERLRSDIAQLMYTAAHDPLTGLPTPRLLLERLDEELVRDAADTSKIAVLFVAIRSIMKAAMRCCPKWPVASAAVSDGATREPLRHANGHPGE